MTITKEILNRNIEQLGGQISTALFEAGRQVGRLEGSRDTLIQLAALMDAPAEVVTPETLKLADTGAEAGEGQ